MTKVQQRIVELAARLGEITKADVEVRQIPYSAMQSLINKGVLICNVGSDKFYLRDELE
ncbi:hypothetical protein MXF26_12460 [Pantoea dispersa]|uniref:hypothetical protein n=1 Tax=Pantoea dispersa TaxID=59814 RepID=UPI0021CAE198|nr:hypothetical protein [Pantoea dispersa]MEB5837064.1 hypothetical protein [Pantoea dispersa]